MSADNYAVCPRCVAAEHARLDELQEKVTAGYGKLPLDEFDALRTELAVGLDPEKFRTFREDYEIYGAESGTVTAVYSGNCSKCGLGLEFNHEEPIPGAGLTNIEGSQ